MAATGMAATGVATAVAAVAAAEQPQTVAPASMATVAPTTGMAATGMATAVAAVAAAEQPQAMAPASMATVASSITMASGSAVTGIAMTSMAAVTVSRLHRFGGPLHHGQADHGNKRGNPHQKHSVHPNILLCKLRCRQVLSGIHPLARRLEKRGGTSLVLHTQLLARVSYLSK